MRSFKVSFINWKGKESMVYITAKSEKEARETASVMQGMFKIIKLEESQ